MLSKETLAFGQALAKALLGVDALYRAESKDAEGLVVVNMAAGFLEAEPFDSYEAARARFSRLRELARTLPEADRRRYYDQVCHSTLAFIRWRNEGLAFTSQLPDFLHVPAAPASDAELDGLRRQIRDMLNAMGYNGDLASQCAAWEMRNRVPPDEVPGVLASLMDEAWDRTDARLPIPAPKSDGMQVATVSGVPFNARCNYLARQVELNIDPILTFPGLKHLTVHECYPGHYVQFKLREVWYHEGTAPADGLLSVVNTASSSPFEGIADNGLRMLDWIESDDDRVQALLSRYRAGIGTGAAWRLHALGWPESQVADWLRGQNLAGGEGWVANRMGFIRAPSRAVLIWSYWWGEPPVSMVWERVPPDQRPAFYRYLYGRMHSAETVAMFD